VVEGRANPSRYLSIPPSIFFLLGVPRFWRGTVCALLWVTPLVRLAWRVRVCGGWRSSWAALFSGVFDGFSLYCDFVPSYLLYNKLI
jgi:hypothetical protein